MTKELMANYETLILTIPEITKDESSNLELQLNKIVKASKGDVISFEKWGKFRLAYPVRKNEYGVYYLIRYEAPVADKATIIKGVKEFFDIKYHEIVMRHAVTALPAGKSLEYSRPKSLEEAPELGSFMKNDGFSDRPQRYESNMSKKSEDLN
jgi:small subunit ribosomal protein S6